MFNNAMGRDPMEEAIAQALHAAARDLIAMKLDDNALVSPAQYLVQRGWPGNYSAHVVAEFSRAVKRRYERLYGDPPARVRDAAGHLVDAYYGYDCYRLIAAVYREEMGALVEQVFGGAE